MIRRGLRAVVWTFVWGVALCCAAWAFGALHYDLPVGKTVIALVFVAAVIFFFQAEDGIRDGHVTGVQTCALPILGLRLPAPRRSLARVVEVHRGAARPPAV